MSETFPTPEPALREAFIHAMSKTACTVTIVTTETEAGRVGVTVSANASVSADGEAPTLLVCIHHMSRAAAAIQQSGRFCMNVLDADQASVADCFAGRWKTADGDKFSSASWTEGESGPRLDGALVSFDCRVVSSERVGTHHIFIGAVEDVAQGNGTPLVYTNRGYATAERLEPQALPA